MSYEKKFKDLMAHLVSMSPEPPPYPEETPMARHEAIRKPRPVFVFVGAAALVALLAVPLLLFTGGEEPVAVPSSTTTTTTMPSTSTTTPRSTTTTTIEPTTSTTVPETTTTVPVASSWEGTLFFYQTPENSNLGNPALVPLSVALSGVTANDTFTTALAAIGPEMPELTHPLSNAVPPEVQIVSQTSMETDTGFALTLDMNEAFLDGAGGLLADMTMLNQLIYAATEPFLEEAQVQFTVNREPVEAFGSEGLALTDPVDRETFIDEIGSIFLTEPIVEVEGAYRVAGMARTFEGSLSVQVLDNNDEVVHEEVVQATCGSGCWGEFATEIDADLIVGGESSIRLLAYSAEDGSPTEVITVPIPANGVWQITVGS